MATPHRSFLGWGLLALFLAAAGSWLALRDLPHRVTTDVLELIPTSEREPELALIRELASQSEARVMLFTLAHPDRSAVSAEESSHFASLLASEPTFEEAVALDDPQMREAVGKAVFDQRLPLLFPSWLEKNQAALGAADSSQVEAALAKRAVHSLEGFLGSPAAVAYQALIPRDPLVLIPSLLQTPGLSLDLVSGSATQAPAGRVWAKIRASPLTPDGQKPVFAAIERAKAASPRLTVRYTGVNVFASASRDRAEREFSILNLLSLAAVTLVAALFLRGAYRALHLVVPVAIAIVGAWCAVACFGSVHILVLVLGSLLTGVAIDYGFYIFLQPPLSEAEGYWGKIGRLREPLLASCLTTVLGFAILVFSELPLMRQLGVFVGAGLVTALGAAILYFSSLKQPYLSTRPTEPTVALPRRGPKVALGLCWLLLVCGIARVSWDDDIRQLQIATPEISSEDASIRASFGDSSGRVAWLSRGKSLSQARDHLEGFDRWLTHRGEAGAPLSLALVVPTEESWKRAIAFARAHPDFPDALDKAGQEAGFEAGAFAPFAAEYKAYASKASPEGWEQEVRALAGALGGPAALLVHTPQSGQAWFVTLTPQGASEAPPEETMTIPADELRSLNAVFSRYRRSALLLSSIGLAVLGIGVFVTYGIRDGWRIFSIPCGACLAVFGLWGWVGTPLNLFHLLGAFLGVCCAHNYSIFSASSLKATRYVPVSVRLSALSAAASFGVLGLSAIPAVKALGLTVSAMAIVALVAIETEHLKSSP